MIEQYDALVIVHHDFEPVRNNLHYSTNLNHAITKFLEMRKPVVVVPSNPAGWNNHGINLEATIRFSITTAATEDAMMLSEAAGKNPCDMVVSFGGILSHLCLYGHAELICKKVSCSREVYESSRVRGIISQRVIIDDMAAYSSHVLQIGSKIEF